MTIKRHDGQLSLISVAPILNAGNTAQARTAYGTAAQIIVCETLGLLPIRIDGRFDVCFDAEKDGVFYEIKSVNVRGKVVIYDFRMKKEQAAGVTVFYAILVHRLRCERADILPKMRESVVKICVVPLEKVVETALRYPLVPVVKKNYPFRSGYDRKGYADGYRNIPVRDFMNEQNA